ncbi:ASCH domain-containing protein [Candidatus Daviesbacteria bacterium]|nr:ASCH domain-containing protein [Candidatus Daviesbacteria bacterium]MBI4038052.1 ASCH domain-containing protein [Candidatus Daviesbacteria bacterium]
MKKHLAIFKGETGEAILAGKKTIEIRLSRVKNPPFGVISVGDLIYIKPSGKDIIGQFRVKKVIFYDGLTEDDLNGIKKTFGYAIAQANDYWQRNKGSRYGTLIFIGDSSRFITSPIKFPKKDLRGWVVLE